MDKAKPVMLEARIETACPTRTMVRPSMPEGRLMGSGDWFNGLWIFD